MFITGERSARLMIDGHRYSLSLDIEDKKVKASLKDEQSPIFGPRLLEGEWTGVSRGKRLTLKRKVELPTSGKTKSERIQLRYQDPKKRQR